MTMLKRFCALVTLVVLAALLVPARVWGQQNGPSALSGTFHVPSQFYTSVPLLVGLNDASGLFGEDPDYIAPKDQQMLGKYTGNAADGQYTLDLPAKPVGRPFDVTGAKKPNNPLMIFDVRLLSDVASKGYMVPNEDDIASSLKITVDYNIVGGNLLVWAADDKQQFPSDYGADQKVFTSDDPRATLPAGWTLVNMDTRPFTVSREPSATVDLNTTGGGDIVDYSALACPQLIPALLDRMQRTYPFTKLHQVDWDALRAKLVPASKTAQNEADCDRLIREIGSAVHDGHMNYSLPALRDEYAGSMGIVLAKTSDNQVVVTLVRKGGPADQAGIKVGAIIVQVDGKPILDAAANTVLQFANQSTPEGLIAEQLLLVTRGALGSTATVTFQNPGEQPKTATLTRDTPKPVGGSAAGGPDVNDNKLPSGIGYLRLPSFDDIKLFHDFDHVVDQWVDQKVPGVIIDIRGNPGGLSQIGDAMASRFFDKSFVIGREIGKDGRVDYLDMVDPRQPIFKGCVALLVDLNSYSTSDLFAYTFKSTRRAVIVGNTGTSGAAGTVSGGEYKLPNDGFIQLPTGGFYDDKGSIVIEGVGVQPDVKVSVTVASLLSPEDEVIDAADTAVQACAK